MQVVEIQYGIGDAALSISVSSQNSGRRTRHRHSRWTNRGQSSYLEQFRG